MANIPDETFIDDAESLPSAPAIDLDIDIEEISDVEKAKKKALARKRIDELMEQKRLKELLDDTDDWDI